MPVTRATALHLGGHISQLRVESKLAAEPLAGHRANERARLVERQRRNVAAEIAPDAALVQMLLDVRRIKHGHSAAVFFQVSTHRPKRLRSGEVSDERDDEVIHLE